MVDFVAIEEEIRNSPMRELKGSVHVATLAGPAIVLEVIVQKASKESGIPMDWHYFGGRGAVWAIGDVAEARRALYMALPQSDLTMDDAFKRRV